MPQTVSATFVVASADFPEGKNHLLSGAPV